MVPSAEWSSWALKCSWCGRRVGVLLSLFGPGGWWHETSCPAPPPCGTLHSPRASGFERQGHAPCSLCSDSPHAGEPQRPCWMSLLAAACSAMSTHPGVSHVPFRAVPSCLGLPLDSTAYSALFHTWAGCWRDRVPSAPRPRSPHPGPADLVLHPFPLLGACAGALSRVMLRIQVSGSRGWWPFLKDSPTCKDRSPGWSCPDGVVERKQSSERASAC